MASHLMSPDDGKRLVAVVNAVVDTRDLIRAFAANRELTAGLGTAGTVMSTTVMASGMVGIGIALASAFANSGPSANELILGGLGRLSEQIEQFRKEMHGRFDAIDRNLEIIFQEMTAGFRTLAKLQRLIMRTW